MANQPFTPELAEWVFSQDWFPREQELAFNELFPAEFRSDDNQTDDVLEIFLNQWIIYDRPTSTHRRTPLELFIDAKVKHKLIERSVFEGFKQSWLGAFGVEAIDPLRSLTLIDLATGRVFEVQEERGTIGPKVGDVMFARVLPYGDKFLLGAAYALIQDPQARSIRYTMNRLRSRNTLKLMEPLTARELAPFILRPTAAVEKWQHVVELDDFLNAKKYTKRSAADIVREFERLDDPNGLVGQVLNDVSLATKAEVNDLSRLLMDLWNTVRAKVPQPGERGAGPIEQAIVHDMLDQMAREQPTANIQTAAEVKILGKKWYQHYLHIPQKELNGRTPWQTILAERQERDNPDTGFSYEFSAIPVPDPELDKFQEMFDSAVALFKQRKFTRSLNRYKKMLINGDDKVPEAWRIYGNMGACACELYDFETAKKYLEKAVSLNPEYELARKNLERLNKLMSDPKHDWRMLQLLNAVVKSGLPRSKKKGKDKK